MSPESVLFRQHSHFYSLAKLLMRVGLWAAAWALCGRLWVPAGFCGDLRSGAGVHGGCSAGWARGFFFWFCAGSMGGCTWYAAGVPSSLVAVTCALPGVVPA